MSPFRLLLAALLLSPLAAQASSWVYFSNSGELRRALLDGSGEEVVSSATNVSAVALDPLNLKVYFSHQAPNQIVRAEVDGSAPESLVASERSVTHLALAPHAGLLFWADGEGVIRRSTLDGADAKEVRAAAAGGISTISALFVDEASRHLYWSVSDPMSPESACDLVRSDFDGAQQVVLVTIPDCSEMMATVDARRERLYWWTFETGLVSANLAGEDPVVIIEDFRADRGLAVDPRTEAVFGADGFGHIWRYDDTLTSIVDQTSSGQIAIASLGQWLERIREVAPGEDCAGGGHAVEHGRDGGLTGDGLLEDGEVEVTTLICHSLDARQTLLRTERFETDPACPAGGVRIDAGLDDGEGAGTAHDGELHPDEVRTSTVVCDGGAGQPGADGFDSLLRTTELEAADERCGAGGILVEAGLDDGASGGVARNGVLEDGEVRTATVVCHGRPGEGGQDGVDAATPLVASHAMQAGDQCPAGGTRLDAGLDDGAGDGTANDGVLQPGEVKTSAVVCHGVAGESGPVGQTGAAGESGCASGGAGLLALLGLAVGRRRRLR